jgi:hypothetical protein
VFSVPIIKTVNNKQISKPGKIRNNRFRINFNLLCVLKKDCVNSIPETRKKTDTERLPASKKPNK